MNERDEPRRTFEQVAELYDRARPGYPAALIDDLAARVPPGAWVLEIGPGTGQATLPLAERGLELVGVELGAGLAELARSKLAAFPNVEIVNAAFEEWEPERAEFDAIVSFTAFHWLDPRHCRGHVVAVAARRHEPLTSGAGSSRSRSVLS